MHLLIDDKYMYFMYFLIHVLDMKYGIHQKKADFWETGEMKNIWFCQKSNTGWIFPSGLYG